MIPMSLYVTIEFVKVGQAQFMECDEMMSWKDPYRYDATKVWMKVKSSSLNEELGQIDYVFTDKTGTLTQNRMVCTHSARTQSQRIRSFSVFFECVCDT